MASVLAAATLAGPAALYAQTPPWGALPNDTLDRRFGEGGVIAAGGVVDSVVQRKVRVVTV